MDKSSHPSASPTNTSEYGEFLHIPGSRFYDFAAIRREIESETARIAGSNKGINRLPINLKIYSPHVLNLTLVDLPGLTKLPIGDQPSDIEKQIRNLILEYIAKPNSIILAVSPATDDLVNSESLKLARQVDPQGKRTIGILTKMDLMDHGTNALEILTGRVYPLKLGFIGVVNRSQQDIASATSLRDSLARESEFFQNHPVYRNISHKCGTSFLAKTLNNTLINHIRERLPDIKARLNTLIGQTEQELAQYGGDALFSGKEHRGTLILQLMTRFANNFVSSIEGTSLDISTKELCGGARIYYIYNEVFGHSIQSINALESLSLTDIRTAIRNSTGPRPSLFVPELAFDLLVKPQIKLLEGPSNRCVELVYEELMRICHNCGSGDLDRYPKLKAKIIAVVSDLLRVRLGPTCSYVESLISIHRAYINTNHPQFIGAASAMQMVMEEKQAKEKAQKSQLKRQQILKDQNERKENEKHDKEKGNVNRSASKGRPSSSKDSISNGSDETNDLLLGGDAVKTTSIDRNSGSENKESFLNYFFGGNNNANGIDNGNGQPQFSSTTSNKQPGANSVLTSFGQQQQPGFLPGSVNSGRAHDHHQSLSQSVDELNINSDTSMSDSEIMECELIRRLIISYFDIVREMIQDQVPKAIMCLLVNHCRESVQNTLVSEIYKETLFDSLLFEDENLVIEREKCKKVLETYKQAAKIISETL